MKNDFISLKEIAQIQVGYQTRGRIEESLDGSHCVLRPQDIDAKGGFDVESLLHFYSDLNIDPENYLVGEGNIIIKARGLDHKAILINQKLKKTVAANSFYIIKIIDTKQVIPQYLSWFLNLPETQNYFEIEQGLSTIPFITIKTLLNTPVLLSSLNIQKKISALVSLWEREQKLVDELVNYRNKLIHAVARRALTESMEDINDR